MQRDVAEGYKNIFGGEVHYDPKDEMPWADKQ